MPRLSPSRDPARLAQPFRARSYYTTKDLALLLESSPATIARAMDRGDIPFYRLPGSRHRRISAEQLREFLEAHPEYVVARRRLREAESAESASAPR